MLKLFYVRTRINIKYMPNANKNEELLVEFIHSFNGGKSMTYKLF